MASVVEMPGRETKKEKKEANIIQLCLLSIAAVHDGISFQYKFTIICCIRRVEHARCL